jgi:hypothetical protein
LPYVEEKLSPFEEQLGRLLNKFPSWSRKIADQIQ